MSETLLDEYLQSRSPDAFRQIVDRYIDIVYASARRQVRDGELAKDVTQAVFLVLVQKAAKLDPTRPLLPWLMQVTRYAAANAKRRERTREFHEHKAGEEMMVANRDSWEEWSPMLDEGISKLRAGERDALVLRYFEKKTAREVGAALGISEDAAEKRVLRAVEKLRDFFKRRGVAVGATAVFAGLATRSAEAAPNALRASVASGSLTSAIPIAKGAVMAMTLAKTKMLAAAAVVGVVILGSAAVVVKNTTSQATAAPVAANDAATVSPAIVRFDSGSTIELVGITDQPNSPAHWWSADGTPIAAPNPLPRAVMHMPQMNGYKLLQFAFARKGAAKDDAVRIDTSEKAMANMDSGDNTNHNSMFALKDSLMKTDLIFRIAAGEWAKEERFPVKPNAPQSASQPTTAPSLQVLSVTEKTMRNETMAVVAVKEAVPYDPNQQKQICAITADGKELMSRGSTGRPGGMSEYSFACKKDDIVALVVRNRPFETHELRNVSLKSGNKTTPTTQPAVASALAK